MKAVFRPALAIALALPCSAFGAETIAQAQLRESRAGVIAAAQRAKAARGTQVGLPETPDVFVPAPAQVSPLTSAEITAGFERYRRQLERDRWWAIGEDPTQAEVPLRNAASVVVGCACAIQAGCDRPSDLLRLARDAADYLMWAQQQGGRGLFPFPAVRGGSATAFQASEKFLREVERLGRLNEVVVNGWIVDDLGGGDLQYDNGMCGVAMVEMYRLTGEFKYLQSARLAAQWAMTRPCVPNWNYNSFSIYLLCELYKVDPMPQYVQAAVKKAQLGVYPGQLTSGPRTGRWFDAHNSVITYHYIITRAMTSLMQVASGSDRLQALKCLRLALAARNIDFETRGVGNVESALEALLLLNESSPALSTLERYCTAKYRTGSMPVAPGVWGRFLAYRRWR